MDIVILLFVIQGAIGAFDILYHHEFKERLPWRREASGELLLHGARNVLYVFLYLALGWIEYRGAFAWALCAILVMEAGITFWDFVVEDHTRILPASERVTHAILTLNYGVILALFTPEILSWAAQPTELRAVDRGWWPWVIGPYLAGVVFWSFRDLARAFRLAGTAARDPIALGDILDRRMAVLVTGGTGFIGTRLVEALIADGHRVTVAVRDKANARRFRGPVTLIDSVDQLSDDTAFDAIVNLAGAPIAEGRWTRTRRRLLVGSRVDTTRSLVRYIARARCKPDVFISGSAIGYYRGQDAGQRSTGPTFAQRLCRATEACAREAERHGVRVVLLRTGIVLGADGGALAKMLPAFDLGLGGRMGDGRQWMSWIHIDDMVRLIAFAIATDHVRGALDAAAPMPVRNAAFAAALGRALRRPAICHAPAWILRLAMGRMADEIVLSGPFVLPKKAQGAGFRFAYPTLEPALADILGRPALRVREAFVAIVGPRTSEKGKSDSTLRRVLKYIT